MTNLPVRQADTLYKGLHDAFIPHGLLQVKLNDIDFEHIFQSQATAIVTVGSAKDMASALSSCICVAGEQVCNQTCSVLVRGNITWQSN